MLDCTLITASCDGLSYNITLNEECRTNNYKGVVPIPTELAANGQRQDSNCIFTQSQDNATWSMHFDVDQCNITARTTNESIEYPVSITGYDLDIDQVIYRVDPGFHVELSCSFHRKIQFNGGGWSVSTTNGSSVTIEEDEEPKNIEEYFNFGISDATRATINETQVSLGQDLTFVVTTDTSIDYKLTNCWATPTAMATDNVEFVLIENGCAKTDWIKYNLTNFTFPFFAFVSSPDWLYVHCELLLCDSRQFV